MKIWIVEISDFLPKVDGNNRLYRAGMLANALVGCGHKVLWWSSTFNHQLRCQRYNISTTVDIQENYRLRLLSGPGYKRSISLRRWRHNRATADEFAKEIAETSADELPDIIYACLPTLEVSEQAVLFSVRHGIPVVIDVRELWPDNYLTIIPSFLRPVFRLLLKQEFSRAYRILSNSTAITSSSSAYLDWALKVANREHRPNDRWFPLCSITNKKATCSSPKADTVTLPNGRVLNKNTLFITYVGSFSNYWDYKTIMKVARDLFLSGEKGVHFLLVGDGDHMSFLQRKCKGLDNIHLTGWLEKMRVDEILSISSVGLVPYTSTLVPTLPNKPFEYMAASLPILSSLGGDLQNLIKQYSVGLQYKAEDRNDLKDKIMWFLSHPEETKAMGQRAKALFEEKYNADVVYPDLVEHLTKIASGRYQTNE